MLTDEHCDTGYFYLSDFDDLSHSVQLSEMFRLAITSSSILFYFILRSIFTVSLLFFCHSFFAFLYGDLLFYI